MDEREYFERLDSNAGDPDELFEHFERRSADGLTYHALTDGRHGVERGTVVVESADAVVRGYPSIPRILVLDPGMREFFGGEGSEPGDATDGEERSGAGTDRIAVEEKLDGFNVRIADVGEVLAFTRSGYVCPFTTARARDALDPTAFFEDHPRKVVCAELVGPETPYTSHDYDDVDGHEFRVFGIRDRASGEPLPVERRREVCERYGFDQPRLFGTYDPDAAVAGVREAIADLDRAGREGVVMKSADGTRMVKYTTEAQHHAELAYAFSLPFDYGRDFLFSRVIRDAFQAAEFDDPEERRQRARDLGESILLPMVETIHDVEAGETVGERHTVRGDPDTVAALLAHLRDQALTLDVERDSREDGERVVEFVKVAESTRDTIGHYLAGGTRDE